MLRFLERAHSPGPTVEAVALSARVDMRREGDASWEGTGACRSFPVDEVVRSDGASANPELEFTEAVSRLQPRETDVSKGIWSLECLEARAPR